MLFYDMKPVLLQCSRVLKNHKIKKRRYLGRSSSPSACCKAWSVTPMAILQMFV